MTTALYVLGAAVAFTVWLFCALRYRQTGDRGWRRCGLLNMTAAWLNLFALELLKVLSR